MAKPFGQFLDERAGTIRPTTTLPQGFGDFLDQQRGITTATPGQPSGFGDLTRSLAGGAIEGAGLAVEGLGNLAVAADDLFNTGSEQSAGNLTRRAGLWIQERGQRLYESRSDLTKQAIQSSQISGNLFKPDTWNWGEDPSARGIGMQVAQVFGQLAPIVIAGVASGGTAAAGIGGLQGSEAGRDFAENEIDEAWKAGTLDISPRYRELIAQGNTPEQAYQAVRGEAGDVAQLITLPVSALGGLATQRIITGSVGNVVGGNVAGRVLASGVVGATEEGVQEVAENVASKAGVQVASGLPQDYGEGTFADFALGAMAGGPVGGAGGAVSRPESIPDTDELQELDAGDLGATEGSNAYNDPTNTLLITADRPVEGGTSPETGSPVAEQETLERQSAPDLQPEALEAPSIITPPQEPSTPETQGDLVESRSAVFRNDNQYRRIARVAGVEPGQEFTPEGLQQVQQFLAQTQNTRGMRAEPEATKLRELLGTRFNASIISNEGAEIIDLTEVREKKLQEEFDRELHNTNSALEEEQRINLDAAYIGGFFDDIKVGERIKIPGHEVWEVVGFELTPMNTDALLKHIQIYKRRGWGKPFLAAKGTQRFLPKLLFSNAQGEIKAIDYRGLKNLGFIRFTGPKAKTRDRTFEKLELVPEIKETLKQEMEKLGLTNMVNLKFFNESPLKGKDIIAYYTRDINGFYIGISNYLSDAEVIPNFRHEVIHFLDDIGYFKTPQGRKDWKVLKREVQKQGISDHVKNNYDPKDWIEESIAIMVEGHTELEQTRTPVEQALSRIRNFFQAIGNWARGLGFRSAEDVTSFLFKEPNNVIKQHLHSYSQDTNRVMYSMDSALKAATKKGVKVDPRIASATDHYTRLTKHGWTIIQLAKKNLHIPWLQNYVQHASAWHGAKTKWLAHANETIGKWSNLSIKQQQILATTLFEVEQMTYRTPEEIKKGVVRKPTKAELIAIFKKNKISRNAVKVYTQVRADFDAMLHKIEEVAVNETARTLSHDTLARDLEIAKIHNEFKQLKKAPYFPHSRFGKYTIIVKNNKGKTVYAEMFESERSRNRAFADVSKKFSGSQFTVSKSKLTEEAEMYAGLPRSLLLSLKNNLDLSSSQKAALEEMLIHQMPAISFKNHFVRKENIPGYTKDAMRAYADYFWHGANHIARIEFGPKMEDEILGSKQNISEMIRRGEDSTTRVKISDFIRSHYESIMNPKEDWAVLRSIGFMWWLGFNVKSAVLNFTQVPMVTQSYLASQFGDAKSLKALSASMFQLRTMYRTPEKAANKAQKADLELIQRGIQEGFLDESFAAELAGYAEGSNLSKNLAKTQMRKSLVWFNHMGGYMFQAMEKVNRRVSFMAAVKLARDNPKAKYLETVRKRFNLEYQTLRQDGLSDSEAVAFLAGKDAVESTQFNYSAWARPKIMEGRKSAFLTFFMFTQNMLWFIANSPGNTRYLTMLLMFGGLLGMPFAEDLEELSKAFAMKAFGKEFNPEKELRAILIDVLGEDGPPPDLFLKGLSRYGFGLHHLGDLTGLPLPSVDMSASVGMGSPIPVISPAIQAGSRVATGRDFEESLGQFTAEGVGATLSIPINMMRAISDSQMEFTDPKRWEKAMPAALSGVSKALRYGIEGSERTRTGAEIVEFDMRDPNHFAEVIARGAGFTPTRVSQTWDAVIMQREGETFWTTRRGLLLRQYDWAKESGDRQMVAEVRQDINRFNKQVPDWRMKITWRTLDRSYKQRELSRTKQENLEPRTRMMEGVYREVQELHPELRVDEAVEPVPSGR